MSKAVIRSFEDLQGYIGKELGVSNDHTITQEQINKFAEATLDFQWIHTDPERAKRESPFKDTIAHGYLTLALLPYLWDQIVDVQNLKLQVNYGIEKFKFNQPVLVNQKVRLVAKVINAVDLRGVIRTNIGVKLEIEGNKKPAYEGETVFLYHFEK